jgi:three-Cys-motif partner protein
MTHHNFGGDWTTEKLERIRKYLSAYMMIFSRNKRAQNLTPIYIDAFAGTGYRTISHPHKEIGVPLPELTETDNEEFLKGSARIALEIEPPFKRYIFIERDRHRANELENLKAEFSQMRSSIEIIIADANTYLKQWCARMTDRMRSVLFLDPYGMQVEWSLIEMIAKTKKIDLWILFPLGIAVNRLLTRASLPPEQWAQTLTRIFGTEEWKGYFYPQRKVTTLFGEQEQQIREADYNRISEFFIMRLKTIFPAVAENPLPLLNSRNNPLYLLCFAASNPRGAPTAVKIAQDILGKS